MKRSLNLTLALAAFAFAAMMTPGAVYGQAPAGGGQGAPGAPGAPGAGPARGVTINATPAQRAHADIAGEGIKGTADFEEFSVAGGTLVRVTINVQGLTPGAHGMHIHAVGRCDPPDFATAGGHFDPGPYGQTNADTNHPYHSGDLPNLNSSLAAVGTTASTVVYSNRFTLGGPLSIGTPEGTALIIHAGPDTFATGTNGQMVGGGRRIACGVIRKTF
jgi:superoxide dismutase, Cu-Zn family